MRVLGEYFIADGVLIFILVVFGPVHLNQFSQTQRLTGDWTPLKVFYKLGDIDALENVAVDCADWLPKWS